MTMNMFDSSFTVLCFVLAGTFFLVAMVLYFIYLEKKKNS